MADCWPTCLGFWLPESWLGEAQIVFSFLLLIVSAHAVRRGFTGVAGFALFMAVTGLVLAIFYLLHHFVGCAADAGLAPPFVCLLLS